MKNYQINTTLFGQLDIPVDKGLCKRYAINLDNRNMNVWVTIFEDYLSDKTIVATNDFIEHIPEIYKKASDELLKIKDSNAIVKYFIECHLDELEDDMLEIFDVDLVKKITSELFIKKLELRNITIAPISESEIDCTLDFSLPEEYSDELLVLRFNEKHEIYVITHES